jgi:phytol kinase
MIMLQNNAAALALTFALALIWLRLNDIAAHRGWLSSPLSRKFIHMGTGPIFVASWLFFRESSTAPYLAALVPLLITAQFALVGLGIISDDAAVKAMSRSGDRREILRGPLYYGVVFIVITLLYWRTSPIGIIGLMLMCGGDGLADVVGRRWGRSTLPWSARKTWIGSLGMFAGGWVFSIGILTLYLSAGYFGGTITDYLLPVTWIALVGTLVESLPIPDLDNLTVTGSALIMGHLLLTMI